MAETPETSEATIQQIASQAPAEAADQPVNHETVVAEKHKLDNDGTDAVPHKRYRAEPHHSILLTNETPKTAVRSPSQYVTDFLKSKPALSIIPEEERGSIFIINLLKIIIHIIIDDCYLNDYFRNIMLHFLPI